LIKIAIIGQQCSGKSTAAMCFQDATNMINGTAPSIILKFAGAIYGALEALKQPKNRGFMQEFADVAKKYFGEDVLQRVFEKEVKEHENDGIVNMIICDDVRRFYELYCVLNLGFHIIALDVPRGIRKNRAERLHLDFIENHNSETEVPDIIQHCKDRELGHILIDKGGLNKDILYETCIQILGGLANEETDFWHSRIFDKSGRIYE
jgi:dephospho-CoA kinase